MKSFREMEVWQVSRQLVAEGFGRDSHKDFAHFLVQARGSLCEVETQLVLAVDLGYIDESDIPSSTIASISKMISALVRHLRTSPAPRTPH